MGCKPIFLIYFSDVSNIETLTIVRSTFWCANISLASIPIENGTIHLFPIERVEDYSLVTQSYTSDVTEDLMYTLGALYSFIGFCCFITLVRVFCLFLWVFDEEFILGFIFGCILSQTVKKAIENQIPGGFHIDILCIVCLPSYIHVLVSHW